VNNFLTTFANLFKLDLRSIALMRILIGGIVLIDLCTRLIDFKIFYTDEGIVPFDKLISRYDILLTLSWLSHASSFQVFVFAAAIISSIFLMLGYKTRLANIMTWVFLISIQNRNPIINYGADQLLACTLFFGIFLPWGSRFSLDNLHNNFKFSKESNSYFSFGTLAFCLQASLVYFFSGLNKTHESWRENYNAISTVFNIERFLTPLGESVRPFILESMIIPQSLTILIKNFEMLVPILLFFPVLAKYTRNWSLVFLFIMHFFLSAFLVLNQWAYLPFAILIGLIPSKFWDLTDRLDTTIVHIEKIKVLSLFPVLILLLGTFTGLARSFRFDDLINSKLNLVMLGAGLGQNWSMFSVVMLDSDGWPLYLGVREDGVKINLKSMNVENFIKPSRLSTADGNDRWRHLYIKMRVANKKLPDSVAQFLCKQQKLKFKKVIIYDMRRKDLPNKIEYDKLKLTEIEC
jgi:hypothetical protein